MKNIVYKPIMFLTLAVTVSVVLGIFHDAEAQSYYYANPNIPAPTVTFVANPTTIRRGESAALSWTATNADLCTASGGWSGFLFTAGAENVAPRVTTEYAITCSGYAGTAASRVTVTVTDPPAVSAPVPNYYIPNTPQYNFFPPYQVPGTTYPTQIPPTVTLTVNPASTVRGQAVTVSWYSANANSCYATGAWSGTKNVSGSEVVYPQQTATYTIVCTNAYTSAMDSKTVVVNVPVVVGGLGVACSPSTGTTVSVGRGVTFTATSVGASGAVFYQWSGDVTGVGPSISATYSTLGRKTAVVRATDSAGRTVTASCYVDVVALQAAARPAVQPTVRTVSVTETEIDLLCRAKGYVKLEEVNLAKDEGEKYPETATTTDEEEERPSFLSFLAFGGGGLPPGLGLFLLILLVISIVAAGAFLLFRLAKRKPA